jgi:cobalt-precorrin 5A hydrolase
VAASSLVAGFGFREAATVASLRSALQAAWTASERASGHPTALTALTALATAEDKTTHPALIALAHELALPLVAVPLALLAGQTPPLPTTPAKLIDRQLDSPGVAASNRIPKRYGARSLAESSALAGAGSGAQLLAPRSVSADKMATASLAITAVTPRSPPQQLLT